MSWKDFPLSDYERQIISKLPPDIAALADKYPSDIFNAAEYYECPPFPDGYIPHSIEIYYQEDADNSNVFIVDGILKDYKIDNLDEKSQFIGVQIDDEWGYIQIEGKEILNRLGSVILPDVILQPTVLINSVLKGENHDRSI